MREVRGRGRSRRSNKPVAIPLVLASTSGDMRKSCTRNSRSFGRTTRVDLLCCRGQRCDTGGARNLHTLWVRHGGVRSSARVRYGVVRCGYCVITARVFHVRIEEEEPRSKQNFQAKNKSESRKLEKDSATIVQIKIVIK